MILENASAIYRTASRDDLPGIARVYLRAFKTTLDDLRSPNLAPIAVADIMRACLEAEPDCMSLAEAPGDNEVLGYVICIANTGKIWRASLAHGLPLVWVWRTFTGQYGLPLRAGLRLVGDKLRFWEAQRLPGSDCRARILSIAVDPAAQRRGIGKGLLSIALARLRALGSECVRLEVRPGNQAARHLYERFGFERVGQYRDSRGLWDIMILHLRRAETENG